MSVIWATVTVIITDDRAFKACTLAGGQVSDQTRIEWMQEKLSVAAVVAAGDGAAQGTAEEPRKAATGTEDRIARFLQRFDHSLLRYSGSSYSSS